MPDRSRLPDPAPAPHWVPPQAEQLQLSNGIPVAFIEQGPAPLVNVLLVLPHGSSSDPVGRAGLTALMADMLDEGIPGKDALAISDELRLLATSFSVDVDVDATTLAMSLMVDTLEPSLQLLGSFAQEPTLPANEFERRRDHRVAQALAAESEPDTIRAWVVRRALFGEGYGSTLALGTRTTLGQITLHDVQQQYRQVVAPSGAHIIASGGVSRDVIAPVLERVFGGWKGQPAARPRSLTRAPSEHAVHFVDVPGSAQAALAVLSPAPGIDDPAYFPDLVYNRSLGGAFTSRINMNLREDKGYTYGTRSIFRRFRQAGYLAIVGNVKIDTTRASIDEIFREMSDVCQQRPLTDTERDESVNGLLLGFPGRFERVGDVAWAFGSLVSLGRPMDWYSTWSDHVEAVTVADANRAAQDYCNVSRAEVAVVGDRSVVAPTLEGLGMPIIDYDAQGNRKR